MEYFCCQLNGRLTTRCRLSGRAVDSRSLFNNVGCVLDCFSEMFVNILVSVKLF